MATPPVAPTPEQKTRTIFFRRTRYTLLSALVALFVLCVVFAWTTRDAMSHLPFIAHPNTGASFDGVKRSVVDLSPWQTAQALAPLAVTAEETEFAHEAERLADHEVDQAFASALRIATMQAQHRTLAGEALTLSQRVDQFQQLVDQDQALVKQLSAAAGPAGSKDAPDSSSDDTDLDIAKAQLGLDTDELADLQQDLARASGDQRAKIQSELAAHEASMRKYDAEMQNSDGQIAAISVQRYGTLAGRIGAWFNQRSRRQLIEQARQQAQADIRSLTDEHNSLEVKAEGGAPSDDNNRASKLAVIKTHSAERQLLSIYDDRIQTEQQLVAVYSRWADQVLLQHRVVLHLILQSSAFIAFILICMVLGDRLVRRSMRPSLDRRQLETMRMILELVVQVVGVLLILIVLFGAPHQTPTVLGLATAALTIALQDFVLAFFGWFRLVGKRGIRVGDWVEINGVGGEVTEVGLMTTTLLETGNLAERGYPTGRRITFMNGYAIRGQYFNFSTTGQWMWDSITVAVPASVDTHTTVERILKDVQEQMQENTRVAEQEWKRGTRGDRLSQFRTEPSVNLRPSGSGVDVEVRYVTRASERFDMRNRLFRHVIKILQQQTNPPSTTHPT